MSTLLVHLRLFPKKNTLRHSNLQFFHLQITILHFKSVLLAKPILLSPTHSFQTDTTWTRCCSDISSSLNCNFINKYFHVFDNYRGIGLFYWLEGMIEWAWKEKKIIVLFISYATAMFYNLVTSTNQMKYSNSIDKEFAFNSWLVVLFLSIFPFLYLIKFKNFTLSKKIIHFFTIIFIISVVYYILHSNGPINTSKYTQIDEKSSFFILNDTRTLGYKIYGEKEEFNQTIIHLGPSPSSRLLFNE